MVEMTKDQAVARFRSNEQRLAMIKEQAQSLVRVMEEIRSATKTLEDLPENESSAMIPMGGVFIPVKTNPEKIQVDIGSGVVVEKERKEAVETLKKREAAIRTTLQRLQESGSKLNAESMEIRQKLAESTQPDVPVISG